MTRRTAWSVSLATVVFIWMIFFNLRPIRDPDLWWHLASGRYIVTHRTIPKTDIFSLTAKGSPWVDTYWLQEIAVYLIWLMGGALGLTLANAFIVAAILFSIGMWNPKPDLSWKIKLFGIVWIFLAAHPRGFGWGEKASIITLGFLGLLFFTLRSSSWPSRPHWRNLWPFLFMAWANMHRGFILGLIILGIYIVDESIKKPSQARRLMSWGLLCAAATFVNPYGYGVYGMGWQDFKLSPVNVTGWAHTPWGHLELFWVTLALFWAAAGHELWRKQKVTMAFLLTSLLLSILSIRYASLYPYFLIWAIPWLLPIFHDDLKWFKDYWPLLWTAGLVMMASVSVKPAFGASPRVFPLEAVSFLKTHHLRVPFYHEYELGGYYLWSLEGKPPVLIDGRYPAVQGYQALFPEMQQAIQGTPENFHHFLSARGIHCAVVKYPSTQFLPAPFAVYLPRKQWALIYWDDLVLIFIERIPEFQTIIKTNEFHFIEPDANPVEWSLTVEKTLSPKEKAYCLKDAARNAVEHPSSQRTKNWIAILKS